MSPKLKAPVFYSVPTAAPFLFFRVLVFQLLRLILSKDISRHCYPISISKKTAWLIGISQNNLISEAAEVVLVNHKKADPQNNKACNFF